MIVTKRVNLTSKESEVILYNVKTLIHFSHDLNVTNLQNLIRFDFKLFGIGISAFE